MGKTRSKRWSIVKHETTNEKIRFMEKRRNSHTQGGLRLILAAGEKRLFLPKTLELLLPEVHSAKTALNKLKIRLPE